MRTLALCSVLAVVASASAMAASLTASAMAASLTATVPSGVKTQVMVVYYQSKPEFKGTDRFKYQRTNEDNPNDRLNGEVEITVTVN